MSIATVGGMNATSDEYRRAAELREALRHFLRGSDRITRAHGLTTQRYELLLMIKAARDGSERTTLAELIERLDAPQSTVTELVHRVEDLGLVRRELDRNNRRLIYLRLTPEGERRLAASLVALAHERRRLILLLSKLTDGRRHRNRREASA